MENIEKEIAVLKENIAQLISIKNKAFIEYFDETYGATFETGYDFNEFSDLFNESDDQGYFDPFDLSMDENDITKFLEWRYRIFIIENMKSLTECIEKIKTGEQHISKKQLEKDVSDMRKYKKQIQEIITLSNNTIDEINKLMNIADKYRK